MMKKLYGILALALLVVSCKKEPLPVLPEETSPYYSIKGNMDNEWINLNVGQEGILISQGVTYKNGVENYYGQIVSPSQDIQVRVEVTRPEAPITPNGLVAIQEGGLPFLVHEPGCLSPDFDGNLIQPSFLLIKNELGNFVPATEIEFQEYGIYDVTMKFTDVGQNDFTIPVQYGYKPMVLTAEFSTFPWGDSVIFKAINPDGYHEWYIDGSLINTAVEFNYQLPMGIHKVEHKIRDNNNNQASFTTLVRITDYVFDWHLDLYGCTQPVTASNFGKVTVSVITNGKEYSSDRSVANLQNYFNVSNVKYVGNASGAPSRAVFDIAFDATLVDETGTESLSLTGMTGTFNIGLQ